MAERGFELAHFFAWARARAYRELEVRLEADPTLDPNWTFSDIMQALLDEFSRDHAAGARDQAADGAEGPAR